MSVQAFSVPHACNLPSRNAAGHARGAGMVEYGARRGPFRDREAHVDRVLLLLHLAGAIVWIGGMAFVLFALRPAAFAELEPPLRPRLLLAALQRFFPLVWGSIALLLATGGAALATVGMRAAPPAWHAMFGIGLVMTAVFGHIQFAPYRRARRAAARQDWPGVAQALQAIHPLVRLNFVLGWTAIALVVLWR